MAISQGPDGSSSPFRLLRNTLLEAEPYAVYQDYTLGKCLDECLYKDVNLWVLQHKDATYLRLPILLTGASLRPSIPLPGNAGWTSSVTKRPEWPSTQSSTFTRTLKVSQFLIEYDLSYKREISYLGQGQVDGRGRFYYQNYQGPSRIQPPRTNNPAFSGFHFPEVATPLPSMSGPEEVTHRDQRRSSSKCDNNQDVFR